MSFKKRWERFTNNVDYMFFDFVAKTRYPKYKLNKQLAKMQWEPTSENKEFIDNTKEFCVTLIANSNLVVQKSINSQRFEKFNIRAYERNSHITELFNQLNKDGYIKKENITKNPEVIAYEGDRYKPKHTPYFEVDFSSDKIDFKYKLDVFRILKLLQKTGVLMITNIKQSQKFRNQNYDVYESAFLISRKNSLKY